jgi:hypothetical protein
MKIAIENQKIGPAIDLLSKITLKGTKSRHRTKMKNHLLSAQKEFEDQFDQLLKEHCYLDDEGNPEKTSDGQHYHIKDVEDFKAARQELMEEAYILEGGNAWGYLKTMKAVFLELDIELNGADADAYDCLCDEFEKMEVDEKGA